VRRATPLDADDAAELILEAPGGLNTILPTRAIALRVARSAFLAEGSALGFRRTVIAEVEGRVTGIMIRFPGQEWPRLRVRTGLAMLRGAGFRYGLTLVRRGRVEERGMVPIPIDCVYLMSLAVSPAQRSHGIGAEFLGRARWEARSRGFRSVALDVGSTNHGAVRFYQREGFTVVGRTPGRGAGPQPVALRMERSVT